MTTKWQPIKTAPKDGTDILVWTPTTRGGRITMGRWKRRTDGSGYFARAPYINGLPPTHWMPLPEPPDDSPSEFDPKATEMLR